MAYEAKPGLNLRTLGGCKPKPADVRFHKSYVKDKSSGCWLWAGSLRGNGYGRIKVNGRAVVASRYSWELHYGPIPDGLLICHTCDKPSCVNPEHLFVGTQKDNMADCIRKGRFVNNSSNPMFQKNIGRPGEENIFAKLNSGQVVKILADTRKYVEIAADYNTTPENISFIKRRLTWKNVEIKNAI